MSNYVMVNKLENHNNQQKFYLFNFGTIKYRNSAISFENNCQIIYNEIPVSIRAYFRKL